MVAFDEAREHMIFRAPHDAGPIDLWRHANSMHRTVDDVVNTFGNGVIIFKASYIFSKDKKR